MRGRVVDDEGTGVAGATVLLSPDDSGQDAQEVAVTDASGAFEVPVAKANCVMSARLPRQVDGPVEIARDGVELRLGDPSAPCVVKVVDARGEPVACIVLVGRANVLRVLNAARQTFERWPVGREHLTGSEGTVQVEGLAGHTRDLEVLPLSDRYARWRGLWQGEAAQTVRVENACLVEGIVLDVAGNPAPGAHVALDVPRAWRAHRTETDASGRFVLRGGPLGEVPLRAWLPRGGSADSMLACRPGSTLNVMLVLGAKRRVTLVDGANQPRRGVPVRLTWRSHSTLGITNDSGSVLVPDSWWRELSVDVLATTGEWLPTSAVFAGDDLLKVAERESR